MGGQWLIGACLNLVGSVAINGGTTFMKYHHSKNDGRQKRAAGDVGARKPVSQSNTWRLGFAIFAAGNVINFVSMGFAAQSLLAALGSIQFVSNVVFQKYLLHQYISTMVVMATSAIVLGNIVIVAFSDHSSQVYTSDDLRELYSGSGYVAYMITLLILCILFHLLYMYLMQQSQQISRLPDSNDEELGNNGGNVHVPVLPMWHQHLLPVSYAMVSAIIGTQSVTLAKSSSALLRATFAGENQFRYYFIYIVLVAWIFAMIFWMKRLNSALQKFEGLLIVPLLQVLWTMFSIIGGGIYFQEFNRLSSLQMSMFVLGVLIVFSGICMLAVAVAQTTADQQLRQQEVSRVHSELSEPELSAVRKPSVSTRPRLSILSVSAGQSPYLRPASSPSHTRAVTYVRKVSMFETGMGLALPLANFDNDKDPFLSSSGSDDDDDGRSTDRSTVSVAGVMMSPMQLARNASQRTAQLELGALDDGDNNNHDDDDNDDVAVEVGNLNSSMELLDNDINNHHTSSNGSGSGGHRADRRSSGQI